MEYDKRNGISSSHVCVNRTGARTTEGDLRRSLDRIVKRAGIDKKVMIHTLRHSFGSALIRQGVNVSVVSKLMGHADINITYNTYIHVIREEEVKQMQPVIAC